MTLNRGGPFSLKISGRRWSLQPENRHSEMWWALPDAHGVGRHPTALIDLLFHVGLGGALVALYRSGRLRHRLFALHLIAYGAFRFFLEFLRTTPEYALGLTGYQLVSLALILAGLVSGWRDALAARTGSARIVP